MTAPIPFIEPASVNAGDTVKWTRSLADYASTGGWVLAYTFINVAGKFTVTASGQTDGSFLVNVAPATSGAWVAGTYDWRAQVSKAGEVFTVDQGRLTVNPAFSASTLDARTQARRMLDAIEATLEGRAGSAVAEYQIAGRQLRHIPIPELLVLRDRLRADVKLEQVAEDAAKGLGPRGRIQVRFGP